MKGEGKKRPGNVDTRLNRGKNRSERQQETKLDIAVTVIKYTWSDFIVDVMSWIKGCLKKTPIQTVNTNGLS